jgi:hypothetical protein
MTPPVEKHEASLKYRLVEQSLTSAMVGKLPCPNHDWFAVRDCAHSSQCRQCSVNNWPHPMLALQQEKTLYTLAPVHVLAWW